MNELPTGSHFLTFGFVGLALLVLGAVLWAIEAPRQRGLVALWVAGVSVIASTGALVSFWPPRPGLVLIPTFAGAIYLARTSRHLVALPLGILVGAQGFRVLVEILIHQAVIEGISPAQLSWSPGFNYDILSGVSALLLFPFVHRLPHTVLWVWNTLALGLLLWVVTIAILSFPTPIQQFTPDNRWVAYFPYILLPVVLVSAALMGHVLVFRKLLQSEVETSALRGSE